MSLRPKFARRPEVESFEARLLLSSVPIAMGALHADIVRPDEHHDGDTTAHVKLSAKKSSVPTQFLAYRITNPTNGLVNLTPPFQNVLVQSVQPTAGKVYNVLYVAVRNGTKQTFTASDGFTVRLPGFTGPGSVGKAGVPVLTGDQVWKPGTWMVFYVLTDQYYPLANQVADGFQLDAGGRSSTMVPGPSGIFLRLTYDPATFNQTLDQIVAHGPGAEGGAGPKLGLPDTAINNLVAARTNRIDFAGHF